MLYSDIQKRHKMCVCVKLLWRQRNNNWTPLNKEQENKFYMPKKKFMMNYPTVDSNQ